MSANKFTARQLANTSSGGSPIPSISTAMWSGLVAILLLIAPDAGVAADDQKTLTNHDVVEMTKAGLPESTIVLTVKGSPADFSIGVEDLIKLKNSGVSQTVMEAMIERENQGNKAVTAPTPVLPGLPVGPHSVTVLDGDKRVQLMRSTHGTSSRNPTAAIPSPIPLGRKKNEYVNLTGPHSPVRIESRNPIFEVTVPSNVHPEQAVSIARLTVGDYDRTCLASYHASGLATLVAKAQWKQAMDRERVPFAIEPLGDAAPSPMGTPHRVLLQSPLEPGEYAVVYMGGYWDFGVD